MWIQRKIVLPEKPRGFHLITEELLAELPEIQQCKAGLVNFLLQHTSASLSINENADASVRADLESHLSIIAPEGAKHYTHTYEGADDMPAHLKSALLGVQLNIPIIAGKLALGTWQGLMLGEHRDRGGPRHVLITLQGQEKSVDTRDAGHDA
ncbi:MAG: secondary thiamine-phosphate synthase enzyme YjbQ [Pseudohongiellaceae bacterium]